MIEVAEIGLDLILPSDGIEVVLAQPFVELGSNEPFAWPGDKRAAQLDRIAATLEIARSPGATCDRTHFTVFPEYAIPGLEGVGLIQQSLEGEEWKDGTVVIAGVDGLTKAEFSDLCGGPETTVEPVNRPDRVDEDQWVNCLVTWVKTKDDRGSPMVCRWIQPKLCPSWPEQNIVAQDMFEGRSIYLFKGHFADRRPFNFLSLICFDWIGQVGGSEVIHTILHCVNKSQIALELPRPLHLIVVLQRNKKPNHPAFLGCAFDFFSKNGYPFVERRDGVVLFVNSAGRFGPGPCKEYGSSGLVFHPQAPYVDQVSPPSYAVQTRSLRGCNDLQTCKDALLREKGQCVHSFRLIHPATSVVIPGSPRLPLRRVKVHALDNTARDPRTPGEQVPAVVKWTNDTLDGIEDFSTSFPALQDKIGSERTRLVDQLRWAGHEQLTRMMAQPMAKTSSSGDLDVDNWSESEKMSLGTLLSALTLVACCEQVEIEGAPAHAFFEHQNSIVDIVVISGATHEDNINYATRLWPGRSARSTLIVSRDSHDLPFTIRDRPVFEPMPDHDASDNMWTGPRYCGFHDLKACLRSQTLGEMAESIRACMV